MAKKIRIKKHTCSFLFLTTVCVLFCFSLCGCPRTVQNLTTHYWILLPVKYTAMTYLPKSTSDFTVDAEMNEKISILSDSEIDIAFMDDIYSSTQMYQKYMENKDNWNVFSFETTAYVYDDSTDKSCSQIVYFKLYSDDEEPVYFSLSINSSLVNSEVEYSLPTTCIQGTAPIQLEVDMPDIGAGVIFYKTKYSTGDF